MRISASGKKRTRSLAGWLLTLGAVVAASGASLTAEADLRLIEAVRHRDTKAVAALLAQHVDVKVTQADGATALHWAAYLDDLDSVQRLLQAGANASAANEYGVTPLVLACDNANAAMVKALLAAGANPNAAVAAGETVLMSCARTGNADAVSALLSQGADPDAKESLQNQTALMWATAERHPQVVKLLLDYGADVYAKSKVSRLVISRRLQSDLKYGELGRKYGTDADETQVGGFTPILFAARVGDVESARLLVAAGANVNETAPDGTSALVIATHSNQPELAKFLLDQGANPNAAAGGYTALHAAVLIGNAQVVRALLAHGARPNAQVTRATRVVRNGQQLMLAEPLLGATPFALAAKFVDVEIMRVLADSGADPLLHLTNGMTPLMLAAGASWRFGVWDRRDRVLPRELATELEMHDERGTLEAVKLAIALGGDFNASDDEGNTALHYVVDKGFDRIIEFLVKGGAKVNAKNNRGLTPLGLLAGRRRGGDEAATGVNYKATADLLQQLGAK